MKRLASIAFPLFLLAAPLPAAEPTKYLSMIQLPGDWGWDYLYADGANRRLYVSHGDQVDVIDLDTDKPVGIVPGTLGVHGIAVAADINRGFTSNGRAATVTVFDTKTLAKLGEVKTGKNPDCILYDPASKRVFTFNGGDKNATAIDAATGKVAGTIDLGGKPEYGAADGAGHVFVNLEDKSLLAQIDSKTLKVLAKWPLAPGNTPSSLAIDAKNHRLFVGCRNKLLVVLDSQTGKVVGQVPIGTGVDATVFDPATNLVYASCGDGTVAVVNAAGDKFATVETIRTKVYSRTMTIDPKTHKLYLPSADFGKAEGRARPPMVPNSFAVLVFGTGN